MKNLYWLVFILILNSETYPQWVQTNGPYGGPIWSLAGDVTKLVAGTQNNGIFLSANFGNDWLEVNSGLPVDLSVYSVAINGENIFAGTEEGLFLSTNFGSDWSKVSAGLPTELQINSITISDNNIFIGTSKGVFLSTNNGTSWTAINYGNISSLAVIGTNLFAGIRGGGVFLTTDNGNKWTAVNSGLSALDIRCLTVSGETIYAAANELFISTNYGASWTNLNLTAPPSPGFGSYVKCIAVIDTNIFAGLHGVLGGPGQGILLSTNNGESWTSANKGLANGNIYSFVSVGTEIFAATDGGVFHSTNYGANWNAVNNGLMNMGISSLLVDESNLFAVTWGNGVIRSTNNGNSWKEVNSGLLSYAFICDLIAKGSELFLGTSLGVFYSLDNGDNWVDISSDLKNIEIWTLAISADGKNIFAGTYGQGVFFSGNNGVKWTEINSGLTNLNINKLYFDPNTGNLFAGTDSGIFLSTNNGESWTSSGLKNSYVFYIVAIDKNLIVSSSNGIFCSTDSGSSWKLISSGLLYYGGPYNIATDGSNLFASHYYSGVFLSANIGISWGDVNNGFSINSKFVYPHISSLAVGTNSVFVGTNRGVWKRPLSEIITDVEGTIELPKEFALYQNYPNPFNPTTVISYKLAVGNQVTLKIYDVLGNEVAVLVNEDKPAGNYEVTWNAEDLSSGVYFYQLKATPGGGQARNFTETKKLILMK